MTKRTWLLIAALGCAIVLTVLGFDWYHVDGEPFLAGWLGATLALFIASNLVDR